MTTRHASATDLQHRIADVERRLETLAKHLKNLDQRTAEIEGLREQIGKLKFELEDMREE